MPVVNAGLVVQALTAFVTGIVYAYVARLVFLRSPAGEGRVANLAFTAWWAAFGAFEFFVSAYQLPNALGYQDLAITITFLNILFIVLMVAIWGLVYYLVYVYTGSSRLLWPITIFYALFTLAILYLIAWIQPTGFDSTGTLVTKNHFDAAHGYGALAVGFGLLLTLPIVLAAIAYGTLYFRAETREQRFRVAVISGSFIVWFGWSTVSSLFAIPTKFNDANLAWLLAIINGAIALVVPILAVMAFNPPRSLRERWRSNAI